MIDEIIKKKIINDYQTKMEKYNITPVNGNFYEFTNERKTVYVPEEDIDIIEGYVKDNNEGFVKSYFYNMFGHYKVKKINGYFYQIKSKKKNIFNYYDTYYIKELFGESYTPL